MIEIIGQFNTAKCFATTLEDSAREQIKQVCDTEAFAASKIRIMPDVHAGKGCTIGHSAIVHACTVGDNTLIGMGSIVLNGAKIGDNCIIAAGAVVTGKMDAPAGSMIMGNPAKVVRPLRDEEIEGNREYCESYMRLRDNHLNG